MIMTFMSFGTSFLSLKKPSFIGQPILYKPLPSPEDLEKALPVSPYPPRVSTTLPQLGGKVLVTGIGEFSEDEFFLNLLNEQRVWKSIVLATENAAEAKKRFMSRTARYSGLLNLLEFVDVSISNDEQLDKALVGSNTWIAMNISQEVIPAMVDKAILAGVKRAVFTVELPPETAETVSTVPEFEYATSAFEKIDGAFTGIRHGEVIPGDENNPYIIVNATTPNVDPVVERGVLARIVAELIFIPASGNQYCGVSSGDLFCNDYVTLLRSVGVNRRQEVAKVYDGGIQLQIRLLGETFEQRKKDKEEKIAARDAAKAAEVAEDLRYKERQAMRDARALRIGNGTATEDDDIIFHKKETIEQRLERRCQEILQNVWKEYDVRMYTKSTSKREFFEMNHERAFALARKELEDEREEKRRVVAEKRTKDELLDTFIDANRKQMAKLESLERKEMANQKEMSDIWVKYVYLLIESTLEQCVTENILFHNLDEYAQTLLLRKTANQLRSDCNLPDYPVVYDHIDATVIVKQLATSPLGVKLNLTSEDSEKIAKDLYTKHGNMLKSIAALRGAKQILELAIETLQRELPPPPPTVNELRAAESAAKVAAVAKLKLQAIRNRNQPRSFEESYVGRL